MLASTPRLPRWITGPSARIALATTAFLAIPFTARDARADAPAEQRAAAVFEVHFLTGMIDHHSMAVVMAEMCLEKATQSELETLCGNIVAAQSFEITQMTSWLLDWYGVAHEYVMKRSEERMMEKMDALEGAEFEIEWMREMIMHHETAIREAARCHRKAEHEQIHTLCGNIEATQTLEIAEMEQWLCDWYSMCRP